jgi:hypothetical protein
VAKATPYGVYLRAEQAIGDNPYGHQPDADQLDLLGARQAAIRREARLNQFATIDIDTKRTYLVRTSAY